MKLVAIAMLCRQDMSGVCKDLYEIDLHSRRSYCSFWGSENQVEVDAHAPVIISEELAKLRIGSVGMNFKCVEVVRDVINRDGGSQSVLGVNFDVFSHTPVCGEIRWKTTAGRLIALKVILIDIDRLIGETTPQLDHGINCHPPWERYAAPG